MAKTSGAVLVPLIEMPPLLPTSAMASYRVPRAVRRPRSDGHPTNNAVTIKVKMRKDHNYRYNTQLPAHDLMALRLGKLQANLLTLEYLVRCFLARLEGRSSVTDFPHVGAVGERVPTTAITDFRPLGALVRKFNADAPARPLSLQLVEIRDLIAHGRLGNVQEGEGYRLLKYSSPEGENVIVTANVEVTKEWLESQNTLVRVAIQSVVDHSNLRYPGSVR